MKIRKIIIFTAILALSLALSATALAANVELGDFHFTGGHCGWATNGTDNLVTDLTIEQLQSAKYLVLEVSTEEVAGNVQVVLQSSPDWAWNQYDYSPDDVFADGRLVIDLSLTGGLEALAGAEDQAKLYVGYWSPDVAGLGITRAYITDTLPAAGGGGDSGSGSATVNPPTGDNILIFIAFGVLAVAAIGAVIMTYKSKKDN